MGAEDRVGDDILGLGGKGKATVGAGGVAVGAEDDTDDKGEEEEAVDLVVQAGAGVKVQDLDGATCTDWYWSK